ncbi:YqjD family protein [Rhodanobacter sp. Si-c]|uniref:YqjD family protein n=1 Tax=Rhodanobacter lycopersici TaxID=3162487 RepID=A0ABV3QCP2_9GAMM
MNKQAATTENGASSRIDEGAERIKQATSSAVASTKEAVERAADHVEESLHRATDKVAAGANRASDKLSDASERSRAAYDATMDRADEWLDQVRDYVREKPVQSVAIAVGAGWLLGRLLRR